MTNTLELLDKALAIKSASAWARTFNIVPGAIANARTRGRLSPVLAGNLAIELGESPEHWIAIAAIEQEKETPLLQRLKDCQGNWRKR